MKRKSQLDKMQLGDKVILLATKEAKVIGHGEVTREYYLDDSQVFLAQTVQDVFPDRIGFSSKTLTAEQEIDFRSLVWDLKFIKNPAYWGAHFLSGPCQIQEDDYNHILFKSVKAAN